LRHFEIELLKQIGYALNFDHESGSQQGLQADQNYEYRIEQGPVAVNKTEGSLVFSGAMLGAIGAQEFDDSSTLRAASRLMREVVAFYLGGKELKSRKVLLDVHRNKNN
jgi:DNA repair protein RecO (recombination protein O)